MFAAVFAALCRDFAWHNLNINVGLSMIITTIALLVFGAVSTSLTQWKILCLATEEASYWGKASLKGWALGILAGILILGVSAFLLGIIIAVLMPGSDEASSWARPLTFAIFALPVAAALGWLGIIYFVGMFQSSILNQFTQQSSHWVRTSIKSGIVGLVVVICAIIILRTRSSPAIVFGILGGVYGMITGAITGTRLAPLLFLENGKEEVANT